MSDNCKKRILDKVIPLVTDEMIEDAYKKYSEALGEPPMTMFEKQVALLSHIIELGGDADGR